MQVGKEKKIIFGCHFKGGTQLTARNVYKHLLSIGYHDHKAIPNKNYL